MKRILSVFITIIIFANILSCSQSQKEDVAALSRKIADSSIVSTNQNISDTTSIGPELGKRRFIRTASLKFKVNKAEDAVRDIEFKSRTLGGFVSFSHLQNSVEDSNSILLSYDSSLQSIHYRTEAVLIVRVPDYQLDSLLDDVGHLSSVMLNREIRCDDVRMQMLANRLSHQRAIKTNQRLAADIDSRGKKLSEIEQAEKTIEEKDEAADNARLSNLTLDDAVKFSTVSIEIYQDPVIVYKQIAREKITTGYQTPFLTQLGESFSTGWLWAEDLIVSFTKYWSILLLMAIGYILFLKYFRDGKKVKTNF
jgi:Domain of unknown function (DUF4349)